MENALIGKVQKDKTVAYIYCHEKVDMGMLGSTLLQDYSTEDAVDQLLNAGHCAEPGKATSSAWELANKRKYKAGAPCKSCDNKRDFLERAVEDVKVAYLFENGSWKYANALSTTPAFVAVQKVPGSRFKPRNKRKFCNTITGSF